ncbi:hypothetical protein QQ045_007586 [Rhodiola kirilowii]
MGIQRYELAAQVRVTSLQIAELLSFRPSARLFFFLFFFFERGYYGVCNYFKSQNGTVLDRLQLAAQHGIQFCVVKRCRFITRNCSPPNLFPNRCWEFFIYFMKFGVGN